MPGPEARRRDAVELLHVLARIFLPGLLTAPFLFLLIVMLSSLIGGLVVWIWPQLRQYISDWVFVGSIIAAMIAIAVIQIHQWWRERLDLAITTNGVVVTLLSIYVALAAAGVRYTLYASDRAALHWSEEIARARWKELAAGAAKAQEVLPRRVAVVSDIQAKLSTCNHAVVATIADHFKFARGRMTELLTTDRRSACTVWLWVDSNITRFLPHPLRDQNNVVVALQRGTISGPRIWFSPTVGLVPEDAQDFPADGHMVLEQAYQEPRRADLAKLLALQATREANLRRRLDSALHAAKDMQPEFGYVQFALASLGQFVGAYGDMIKPVSIPAQIFEIAIGLLRTLFALVFFERLVNTRRT